MVNSYGEVNLENWRLVKQKMSVKGHLISKCMIGNDGKFETLLMKRNYNIYKNNHSMYSLQTIIPICKNIIANNMHHMNNGD